MGVGGEHVLKLQDGYKPAAGCPLRATSLCLRGSRTSRTGFDDGAGATRTYMCILVYVCVALNVCVHIIIIVIMTSSVIIILLTFHISGTCH